MITLKTDCLKTLEEMVAREEREQWKLGCRLKSVKYTAELQVIQKQ